MSDRLHSAKAVEELDRLLEAALKRAGKVERDSRKLERKTRSFIGARDMALPERLAPRPSFLARCRSWLGRMPTAGPIDPAASGPCGEILNRLEAFERGRKGYRPWKVRQCLKSARKEMKGEVERLERRKATVMLALVSLHSLIGDWAGHIQRNVRFGIMAVMADYARREGGASEELGIGRLDELKRALGSAADFLSSSLTRLHREITGRHP